MKIKVKEGNEAVEVMHQTMKDFESKARKREPLYRTEGDKSYWSTGFWQGLSIGLGVAFVAVLVEFIVMIN